MTGDKGAAGAARAADHAEPGGASPAGLLAHVAEGDVYAFAELYDAFAPSVFALVLGSVRGHETAEGVTQEVFLSVWRSARHFDPTLATAGGWIHTIARQRAVGNLLRRHVERPRALENSEQLDTCTAGLTKVQRTARALTYLEDRPDPDAWWGEPGAPRSDRG